MPSPAGSLTVRLVVFLDMRCGARSVSRDTTRQMLLNAEPPAPIGKRSRKLIRASSVPSLRDPQVNSFVKLLNGVRCGIDEN